MCRSWLMLGGLAVLFWGMTATAQAQREAVRTETRGLIKTIDANKGSITIAVGGGRETPATEKVFSLVKDVEVCVSSGRGFGFGYYTAVKLTDLVEGTPVGLTLSADQKSVESIIAEEPLVRGQLKEVDQQKGLLTLTIQAGREAGSEVKIYSLAKQAEILLDDGRGRRFSLREGKLTDLTAGALVTLRLSLDKKEIRSVSAEGNLVNGPLKTLDVEKRLLTLTTRIGRGEEAAEEKRVTLAKDALVLLDDGRGRRLSVREAKLADVPVGSMVQAKLSLDQQTVTMLRAEGPSVFGLLKSVDADKLTITITIPKGRDNPEEKTLPVAKEARVLLDGTATQLKELKPGDNGPFVMLKLTLDQQSVHLVQATQPRAR